MLLVKRLYHLELVNAIPLKRRIPKKLLIHDVEIKIRKDFNFHCG
jgi:hypothetical protein